MDLPKLYDKIYNSKRIYLLSTGLSQQLQAQVLQRNFLKMGISMSLIPLDIGTHLTSAVIEKLEPEDLLIVFSFSGENHAMKEALAIPLLKKFRLYPLQTPVKTGLVIILSLIFQLILKTLMRLILPPVSYTILLI